MQPRTSTQDSSSIASVVPGARNHQRLYLTITISSIAVFILSLLAGFRSPLPSTLRILQPATTTAIMPLSSHLAASSDPPTSVPSPSTTPVPASPAPSTPLPRTFTDNLPLPRVLVFDLDYTLWPFWCDTHCTPPFKPLSGAAAGTAVRDRRGDSFGFYAEVPSILAAAKAKGMKVAAASRTSAPDVAGKLLDMLTVESAEGGGNSSRKKPAKQMFDDLQIYPGNKVRHMEGISKALGVGFEDMVFWDDEERNRNVEREKGVCFWLVRDGVTREEIDRGVEKWRNGRGREASK